MTAVPLIHDFGYIFGARVVKAYKRYQMRFHEKEPRCIAPQQSKYSFQR